MNSLTRDKLLGFFIAWTILLAVGSYVWQNPVLWGFATLSAVCLVVVIHDIIQTKHALLRNFPLIGRLRWVFEHERSKIQQYFIEDDVNGTPYSREKRSDVYQKAKAAVNTTPFGTQHDVYKEGYEFLKHSMFPKDIKDVENPRILIGSKCCTKPYSASVFNISAMSYGALSNAAVRALNGGAKLGDFYHNTGEGGLSPYHLENGGDIVYQIGTGYFGCGSTVDGKRVFDAEAFLETVENPSVKMIEIKLSQGAKPGHGGILPASKNTEEIAAIRGVEPHVDVMSPPYHSAFHDVESMIEFIELIRELSGGRPVGVKLCVGSKEEVWALINTMADLGVWPDFITIDGGEGGTGAAPLVFTNHVGMPLLDALDIVNKKLIDRNLREEIRIIASGKASSSYDILKLVAMGADVVNAARAFMLSLGCIQARECNMNTCPVGIATQNKTLIKALNPEEKKVRVYNYHHAVIHEVRELLAAMGKTSIYQIAKDDFGIRNNNGQLKSIK
jgi:glutamate synthase domain-containing protein 2